MLEDTSDQYFNSKSITDFNKIEYYYE